MRFAACQLRVCDCKESNFRNAEKLIKRAKELRANIVSLPECWNCPYSNASFPVYAEELSVRS